MVKPDSLEARQNEPMSPRAHSGSPNPMNTFCLDAALDWIEHHCSSTENQEEFDSDSNTRENQLTLAGFTSSTNVGCDQSSDLENPGASLETESSIENRIKQESQPIPQSSPHVPCRAKRKRESTAAVDRPPKVAWLEPEGSRPLHNRLSLRKARSHRVDSTSSSSEEENRTISKLFSSECMSQSLFSFLIRNRQKFLSLFCWIPLTCCLLLQRCGVVSTQGASPVANPAATRATRPAPTERPCARSRVPRPTSTVSATSEPMQNARAKRQVYLFAFLPNRASRHVRVCLHISVSHFNFD